MSLTRRGIAATLTSLPSELQYDIVRSLPPAQIASLAQLTRATAALVANSTLWADVALRHLRVVPDNPTPASVRALANALICKWWLLTGLFVQGVTVQRRSGFIRVSARGGIERPIVDAEQPSCYVFGAAYACAGQAVLIPSVSLAFFVDPAVAFPEHGMRLALVHTVDIPEEDDSPPGMSHLSIGHSVTSAADCAVAYAQECQSSSDTAFAAITVKVNNVTLLTSFRPRPGPFQVTHVHVPSDILVCKPIVNEISIEYHRTSTAAYWLKSVSVMPTIIPPPAEENTVGAIRIGEPIPETVPISEPVSEVHPPQSQSPPSPSNRGTQTRNHHRRPARRSADQPFKQLVLDTHAANRSQKNHQKSPTRPKHMYHHNYYRSSRRSSPSSPRARSTR